MKKVLSLLFLFAFCFSFAQEKEQSNSEENTDSISVKAERKYKVLDSKFIENDSLWKPFSKELKQFSAERYEKLKPLILESNIPELQTEIKAGKLTYEELALFYLYRIRKFDRENQYSLNSVISLNPDLLTEARQKDKELKNGQNQHPVFGIPVLLKDNIDTKAMMTTAGAVALMNNQTDDAFIVKRLKENGALILGKANLSEWAYFFCGECPSGYSAVGGQTLNPYGRKVLDTGGSSSGSAVAVAANLAPVAVGSETSGSILSPSSQNSVVGLKPTVGLLSRGGIIPISSTLDTPGPITRSVVDNAILLSAMAGKDPEDEASKNVPQISTNYYKDLKSSSLKGKRFGALKALMEDSLYVRAISDLKKAGAEIVEFEAEEIDLPNFVRLLNLDMKKDLPAYFGKYGGVPGYNSVRDVLLFNYEDTTARAPYGQSLFEGIVQDTASTEEFAAIKDTLKRNGKRFFDVPMKKYNLDGIISINNYHAGYAAVAQYPGITVPMGYGENNSPEGLTFFTSPFGEKELLQWAYVFEKLTHRREPPKNYSE
ncbi:MAG: amidase family protein [Salegentibacter sp.]